MKRTKPLPARATPIARGAPPKRRVEVKRRNAKRKGSLFPKGRCPEYVAWVKEKPCVLFRHPLHKGACKWWPTDPAHTPVSRARGAPDVGAILPMCRVLHEEHDHKLGAKLFQEKYGVDTRALAESLAGEWQAEREEVA